VCVKRVGRLLLEYLQPVRLRLMSNSIAGTGARSRAVEMQVVSRERFS
jgi:hypothetical protein